MNKEQELRPATKYTPAQRAVYDTLAKEGGGTWATYMMADIDAAWNRRSSDEQAEVVAWQVTQYDPNGRLYDSVSLVRGSLPDYYRTERWGSSGHAMWEVIPLYRSPPAVAAGGVTVDPDLLAKQSAIEPDVAAVVYADRSKLYSDFSGGVTEARVEAAARVIAERLGFNPKPGLFIEHREMARAALTAALAVGIREGAKDTVDYVMRYGGRCRDCADENGTCPHSGLPCDTDAASKVIGFVLRAVDYGQRHGYLPAKDTTHAE